MKDARTWKTNQFRYCHPVGAKPCMTKGCKNLVGVYDRAEKCRPCRTPDPRECANPACRKVFVPSGPHLRQTCSDECHHEARAFHGRKSRAFNKHNPLFTEPTKAGKRTAGVASKSQDL